MISLMQGPTLESLLDPQQLCSTPQLNIGLTKILNYLEDANYEVKPLQINLIRLIIRFSLLLLKSCDIVHSINNLQCCTLRVLVPSLDKGGRQH